MITFYRMDFFGPEMDKETALKAKKTGRLVHPVAWSSWGHNNHDATAWREYKRGELVRETEFSAKTQARLLPTWARHREIRGIGAKVTEFYRENDKVVCRTDGILVGSLEDKIRDRANDIFRPCHEYLFKKYGLYADEFEPIEA